MNMTDDANDVADISHLHHAMAIQGAIAKIFDRLNLEKLRSRVEASGSTEDVLGLDDLQDVAAQEHQWWKCLKPEADRILPRDEWVIAMRA